MHELLAREEIAVSYTTLRRYVRRELGWRKKQPTARLDDPAPGQEAQIDFGLMGTITDENGQTRTLHALIVTLSSSRHMFVWPTQVDTLQTQWTAWKAMSLLQALQTIQTSSAGWDIGAILVPTPSARYDLAPGPLSPTPSSSMVKIVGWWARGGFKDAVATLA